MSSGAANNLKTLREAAGWTQAELARRTGIDRSWLNRMEHGKRPIGPGARRKLAEAFRVSPVEIGGDERDDPVVYRSLVDRLEEVEARLALLEGRSTAS